MTDRQRVKVNWLRKVATVCGFLLLLVAAGNVSATVLTFEVFGADGYDPIPQDYGDNVTTVGDGVGNYDEGNGFTPNVQASYRTLEDFGSSGQTEPTLSYWDRNYGDLRDVAFASVNGDVAELTLQAEPGFEVVLNSFDMAGWNRADLTGEALRIYNGDYSTLLFEQAPFSADGDGPGNSGDSFNFSINVAASEVHIQWGRDWNIGIDNVNFDQQAAPFVGSGSGLLGAYCNRDSSNETVPCDSNPDVTRVDPTVDFRSGDSDWPASGIGADTFSVRWTGQIQAQYTEDYTFHALHADGVRVWVDGTLVIDDYVDQSGNWSDSGTSLSLQRGQKYDIVIEYYANGGQQDMVLGWSSASTPFRTLVPESQLYPPVTANLLADYRFDESAWDGTSGEVTDETGNGNNGTARNEATTSITVPDPALPGDPGTCRYGEFDGNDDYVELAGFPDLNDSFTITGWFRTRDRTESGQRIFADDENNNNGYAVSVGDPGSGRVRFYHRALSPISLDTPAVIQNDTWYFVGAVLDEQAQEKHIYIYDSAGNLVDHTQGSFSGTLQSDGGTASIGGETDSGETGNRFDGQLDEIRVYDGALGQNSIETIREATHPCPVTPGSCSVTFPSAVQNTANAGSIDLGFDAQVTDPDNLLETATLNDNVGFGNTSCGGADCTATTPLATAPNVPAFQTASGNNDVDTQGGASSFALGQDGETDYDQVWIRNNETLNDSGNFSTYRIDDLQLNFRSTWNLTGGADYYVDDITLGTRTEINVTGSGTARLFVRGSVTFPFDSTVNSGGTPDRLIIVGYNDVTISTGNAQPVNALVFALGDVNLGFQDQVNGAVAAAGSVTLSNSAQAIYDQGAVSGVDDRGFCGGSGPAVHHYAISHSGTGVTCLSTDVTVTAHDSGDNPVDPSKAALDLSTTTGKGDWNIVSGGGTFNDGTPGDGAATYDFPGGETSVTLALNYTDVGAGNSETFNIDVDDGSATDKRNSSDPEDPDLTFALTGLRFANIDDNNVTIPTQLSDKPSNTGYNSRNLALQAIRASDTDPSQCNAAFPDGSDRDIEIAGECLDPSTCAGEQIRIINNASTNTIPTNDDNSGPGTSFSGSIPLRFTDNGSGASQAEFALRYPDTGLMQLHARYNIPLDDGSPSGDYMTGSSNDFVVRPFGFYLDFDPDGDSVFDDRAANAACADQTSCAGDADGDVFATAGVDFPVRIDAVVWQAADDGNDDGVPDSNQALADNVATPNFGQEASAEVVNLDRNLVAPGGGAPGTLDGGQDIGDPNDQAFTSGSIEAGGVSWDEVGIIDLGASLDSGAYLGSDDVIGTAPNLGRFIPADFAVDVRDAGMYAATCNGTFSYVGEAFGYDIQPRLNITARNAGEATTENYRGSFIKLRNVDIGVTPPSSDASAIGNVSGTTDVAVTAVLNTGVLADDGDGSALGDGVLVYTFDGADSYVYDKVLNARIDADEFNADLPITVDDVTDGDGVTNGALPSPNPFAPTGAEIRFGQLSLENTYGPETEDLTVSLQVEYFDGDGYTVNTADGCTPLSITGEANHARVQLDDNGTWVRADQTVNLTGGTGGTTEGTGITGLTGGVGALTLDASEAGNTGFASVRTDLADFPWLQGDWDDDGSYDDLPTATATFGVYRGNDRVIYWRER
jgi:MSHA biogenesis protein MshQ